MIARLVRDMLHLRMKSQMKNLSIQPNCGWRSDRDRLVSNEEISCIGCRPENWCRYLVVKCCEDKGIKNCSECAEFPCDNIRECFAVTKSFEPKCREVCTEAEYEQIKKAFFEKEENLKALQAANIKDGI